MEENNSQPTQEMSLSEQFDTMSPEEQLSTLMHETEFLTGELNKIIPDLSKKQLQRLLTRTLAYPMEVPEPPKTKIEVDASVLAAKFEHFKILTIKIAADLDNKQKEENNDSKDI